MRASDSIPHIPTSAISVGVVSLGCAKNLVDSEIMLGALLEAGMEITNQAGAADVLIINTCSFIDSAQEESVDEILQSEAVRQSRHPSQGLVVAGCLPQRFRQELPKLLPEVDAFMGIDQVPDVAEIVRQALARRKMRLEGKDQTEEARSTDAGQGSPISKIHHRPRYVPDYATPRFRLTPEHFAYVKIAEGCNHPCRFCIIPRIRGAHRSRQPEDILLEARELLAEGVKELNLISQDSTYYGRDLGRRRLTAEDSRPASQDSPSLCSLIHDLNNLSGRFWIRLLYTHPAHWTPELIDTIAECSKVARYVDMPLQHIHGDLLNRMRRETSEDYILDLIHRIRQCIPDITLRTTFIVGFPGETEEHFQRLLAFIRETKFERMGVFTYSQQEGSPASKMDRQVPEEIKQQRRDLAMIEQRKVARELAGAQVGKTIKVLTEKETDASDIPYPNHSWEHGFLRDASSPNGDPKGRFVVARGEGDAPDIDGRVYVRGSLPLGVFRNVNIVGHTDYDLIAEPLSNEAERGPVPN